ncbi:hypothetical protein SOVF_147450, partial [Spinacia oleracea]
LVVRFNGSSIWGSRRLTLAVGAEWQLLVS